ncbi:hypothetical protein [Marilutibacter alkalisoli]|uniref:DUF481 domain-containing protein n=1 Tax=Marilutibacter alkalisoli TaxID=2591633 RepID=A0A514BSQ6_9GAMM|nr:hypothetical protein [Lysobacter alkalisoli]QDH70434.1 hypothetical protein FKV23_10330 [Lysobacter alkalisoli]
MTIAICSTRVVAGLLALLASFGASAVDPETESLRELELRYRFDASTRLHASVSFASDNLRSFRESAFGIALDRRLAERWSIRVGGR